MREYYVIEHVCWLKLLRHMDPLSVKRVLKRLMYADDESPAIYIIDDANPDHPSSDFAMTTMPLWMHTPWGPDVYVAYNRCNKLITQPSCTDDDAKDDHYAIFFLIFMLVRAVGMPLRTYYQHGLDHSWLPWRGHGLFTPHNDAAIMDFVCGKET